MASFKLFFHVFLHLMLVGVLLVPCRIMANAKVTPNADFSLERTLRVQKQEKGKWLPVPIPMSNPTLGSGLQAVLLYLHPKKVGDDVDTPAATSGLGGMYTNSDSKVIGAFHDNYFANDKYRLKVLFGAADLNLDFYGIGESEGERLGYNIKPNISFAQFMRRAPYAKNSYIGIKHLYTNAKIKFDSEFFIPPEWELEVPAIEFESVTSSLGFIYNYDNRDDSYFPSEGINAEVSLASDSEKWGSDYRFMRFSGSYRQYFSLAQKHILALKIAVSDVDGNPPFYMLSTLPLRGFAAGRYLDNSSFSGHAEWRYSFASRWGVNGFVETGKIGESFNHLPSSNSVTSYGVGLRWQPIASKELNLGVDLAQSEDDSAIYLRVGEAF
ncbi:Outer membrane protein/protective antigen OMA87 [Alteromonadaceae bacterium Bs31]|nr:Outer membrane protein/protective antigen OMA87 [Alteromonadaceae bacterium Bs31]